MTVGGCLLFGGFMLLAALGQIGCQASTRIDGAQSKAERTTDEVRPVRRKTTTIFGPPPVLCTEARVVPAPLTSKATVTP